MPADGEYVVREASETDRAAVLGIVGELWQTDVTRRYDWLYANNPHGRAHTWLVVERGAPEVPVGITSLFPRRVHVTGRVVVGSIGGDCYVVPRARRRGLATQLHIASFAGMHARGVDFMYGPPRPNNLSALLKAGSNDVTVFRRWTRPLTGAAAMRSAALDIPAIGKDALAAVADVALRVLDRATRPTAGRAAWTLERLAAFGPEITRCLDGVARSYCTVPVRDAAWLAWRYLEGPSRTQLPYAVKRAGELVGFVALEALGGRGVVIDVGVPSDRESLDATIELVLAEARALGCETLDASFTAAAPIAARLRHRGFVGREAHGFQVALGTGNETPRAALLDASAWTFSNGDKDTDSVFSSDPDA